MDDTHSRGKGMSRRKLKTHTKSRTGCKNCKVRRVKCDETKPSCTQCQSYGVCCNYGGRSLLEPDLHTPVHGSTNVGVLRLHRPSSTKAMLGMINRNIDATPDEGFNRFNSFKLDIEDLDRLERFQTRTVLSLGTSVTGKIYQQQIIKLICKHPYLMHAVMTITSMHDRFLRGGQFSAKCLTESYHHAQAAALFRRKLLQTVPATDHDGVWATCAILGCMSFFALDASSSEEAWPLKTSPTDLEWLEILEGIHVVWSIVKPTRTGSAFEKLSEDRSKAYLLEHRFPKLDQQLDSIPRAFLQLCEVGKLSSASNNPYLTALHNLVPLLDVICDQNTFLWFLTFTGHMDPAYKRLLHMKDPRALLILSYWYSKVCHRAPWFLASRAIVECRAICIYLERYHAYHKLIHELLLFPKKECGLLVFDQQPITPISMER